MDEAVLMMDSKLPYKPILLHYLVGCLCITSLSACSFAAPKTQPVRVWADSPTADIYVNDRKCGTGRCVAILPRNKIAIFRAQEHNATSGDIILEPELSLCGYTDLCSGFLLFPLTGLLAPGAWQLPQQTVPLHISQ